MASSTKAAPALRTLWRPCYEAVANTVAEDHSNVKEAVRSLAVHLANRLRAEGITSHARLHPLCLEAVRDSVILDHSDVKAVVLSISQTLAATINDRGVLVRAA